ncbi:hypothetical protein LZ30DRAFT_749194 [Colletotrichum cereale]|nr:hypothetical protein LZ30DRAFT_749194 [Colletotrichum cereale]
MTPGPDVAGKDVVGAFTVTAFITLCLAIFCLVVGRTNEARQSFNPIDRVARRCVSEPTRRLMFRVGTNHDLQSLVAYNLVNTFSDLQQLMVISTTLMSYCYAVQTFLSWRTGRLFWIDHLRGHLIDKKGQPVNVENQLVFCQLVPIFLPIIPFMGLFESYTRHTKAFWWEPNTRELDSCCPLGGNPRTAGRV